MLFYTTSFCPVSKFAISCSHIYINTCIGTDTNTDHPVYSVGIDTLMYIYLCQYFSKELTWKNINDIQQ